MNSRARPMKPIFDSDYVKPDENFRVLQDDSVRKSLAFASALKRYEATLRQENSASGQQTAYVEQRIASAQKDQANEKAKKKQAQGEYKDSILQQMAEQVSTSFLFLLIMYFSNLFTL